MWQIWDLPLQFLSHLTIIDLSSTNLSRRLQMFILNQMEMILIWDLSHHLIPTVIQDLLHVLSMQLRNSLS